MGPYFGPMRALEKGLVCGTVYWDMYYEDLSSIEIRVLYPGPRFLSSAAWPSMPNKLLSDLILLKSDVL